MTVIKKLTMIGSSNLGIPSIKDILMNSKFPSQQKVFHDNNLIEQIDIMKEVVSSIRKVRSDLNIRPQTLGDQIIKDGNNEEGGDKNEKL